MNNNYDDFSSIKVICPIGSPSIVFKDEQNVKISSNPIEILSSFNSNEFDIIVIDTIAGLKAINNGASYKIASTITFGDFYLIGIGDKDGKINESDNIVLFGKSLTPDCLFKHLFGNKFNSIIEYVSNVQEAGKVLYEGVSLTTSKPIDYVVLSEPILSKIMNDENSTTYKKARVIGSFRDLYKTKNNNKDIFMASIFVKYSNDKEYNLKINNFLKYIENKISNLQVDPSLCFDYKKSIDNKNSLDYFISIFGLNKTDESIFYK